MTRLSAYQKEPTNGRKLSELNNFAPHFSKEC